jgi:hypothetical protein
MGAGYDQVMIESNRGLLRRLRSIAIAPDKIDPKASLLHEMVHAALDVSGVSQLIKDENLEEAICIAMEMLTPNLDFKPRTGCK